MSADTTTHPTLWQTPDSLLWLVANAVPALMAYYQKDTLRCLFANQRYAEYNGWTPETILGKTVREVIGETAWQTIAPHVNAVVSGQQVRYVRQLDLPNGEARMIEANLIPHYADGGPLAGAFVLINDITDQWQAEQSVRESESRMRKFAEATSEGIVFHKDGVIVDVNSAIVSLSGYTEDELLGHYTFEFIPEDMKPAAVSHIATLNESPYESAIRHKQGHLIPVEFEAKNLSTQNGVHRILAVRDITLRKQAQERIKFLALHDPLTQLPNRQYLNEYLPRMLLLAKRQSTGMALLFLDLDGFKKINDTLGHQAGDWLLCQAANRLNHGVRESDLVVRLGGDEFLIVVTNIQQERDALQVAEDLLADMQEPIAMTEESVCVLPSIGISLYPQHADNVDELISRADTAMYQAKEDGGNCYRIFSE